MTALQLSTSMPQPVAMPAPFEVNDVLVAGLRLPKIPGLPSADTPAGSIKELLGPPKPGSAAAKLDLAVVKGAQLLRTRAGDEWARRMDADGATRMWFELAERYRAETGKAQGWLGTALLASTMAANGAATGIGKLVWKRPRPFVVDPSIKPPLDHVPSPRQSYPSGHSSSAFAAARVISVLEPKLAAEAYSLATQVATSRVYAGVHFPSDVIAGALLGTAVAESVLRTTGVRRGITG